ncbi:MAG: hypothetical protein JWM56_619 [Candidatus Peribacteria bacterium]|nr:hypothetical protein [Candidatus Peribacteria bacterium]
MKSPVVEYDSYLIDTCKVVRTGKFVPGAIKYKGRKKIEVVQWKDKTFDTQEEANAFVKEHFMELGIAQPSHEWEIFKMTPGW